LAAARAKSVPGQRGDQPIRIEHGLVLEHEIDAAGQLDRQHGVGLELVAPHLRFQSLRQGFDAEVVPFGNDGCFPEGPAQVGIAQLGSAQAFDLAGCRGSVFR
jgi:hypothetical protein